MAPDDTNTTQLAKRPVIALYGRAGSGKSECAKILYYAGYERVKFADPLKRALRSILEYTALDDDLIDEMIEGDLKETPVPQLGGKTPRHAMQTLGTEWGRNLIHPDFWVNIGQRHILHYTNVLDSPVVVDDLRYQNEAAAIRSMGGKIVHVFRPDIRPAGVGSHSSEGGLDGFRFDDVIINDGSLEDLRRDVGLRTF